MVQVERSEIPPVPLYRGFIGTSINEPMNKLFSHFTFHLVSISQQSGITLLKA